MLRGTLENPHGPILPGAGDRRLAVISLGIAIGYLAALGSLFLSHKWILNAHGRPDLTDFIAVWSAGKLALAGTASTAYDAMHQHMAEVATLGHDFGGALGWPYPPSFLFVAEALARAPYAWSFAIWVGTTLAIYGLATAKAAQNWLGTAVALAAPWTLACAMVGQNGFLTAGLLAAALGILEERPVICGVLIGLLTYKPQFGLVIPIALIAGGNWRVLAWAVASTAATILLSIEAFGLQAFIGFLEVLPHTSQNLIAHGAVGWQKLQSIYGLVRCLGGSNLSAWFFQAGVTTTVVACIAILWSSPAPYALKAAALAVGAVLATPYVFAYDMPILGVAIAFLYRHQRFDGFDYTALAIAALAFAPVLVVSLPVGLLANLTVAAMVARRVAHVRGVPTLVVGLSRRSIAWRSIVSRSGTGPEGSIE